MGDYGNNEEPEENRTTQSNNEYRRDDRRYTSSPVSNGTLWIIPEKKYKREDRGKTLSIDNIVAMTLWLHASAVKLFGFIGFYFFFFGLRFFFLRAFVLVFASDSLLLIFFLSFFLSFFLYFLFIFFFREQNGYAQPTLPCGRQRAAAAGLPCQSARARNPAAGFLPVWAHQALQCKTTPSKEESPRKN